MGEIFQHWDWVAILAQILLIDLLLGGDNAVVIAMACRGLPDNLRRKAIIIGTVGAIVARIVLLVVAVYLLTLPGLKLVGGLLLLWIGYKLVSGEDEGDEHGKTSSSLWKTALTITIADVIMSLDNVLAVAAAGRGHLVIVAVGVLLSIPIIVAGSRLVLSLLDRWPVIILAGGALIGWIAGSMLLTDPLLHPYLAGENLAFYEHCAGAICAVLILLIGWMKTRKTN
ncbi:TerC family protein [Tatumella sp. TA1]|uniref:YjbE family putative metal transport protein n=1 Tax=Rosenbergiella collisarenosi TaxID=1544695 RepID=UPI0008F8E7E8|nr:YjbE family putative metal transport protein [Rosenbergiella collisarenosi]MBT0721438.1 YjbE family putative metal transport protein [Rosenbergiella collisarenosi]QGX92636.1 TerC family protein [Tatumella sp. TA1]